MADQAAGGAEVLGEGRADALGDARLDAGGELRGVEDPADVLGDGQSPRPGPSRARCRRPRPRGSRRRRGPRRRRPGRRSSSGSVGCGRHWAVAHSSLPSIASVTVVDSTPSYEVILPSVIWSSSVDMPNLWASGWSSWVRTIFAARSTAPPETQVWRPRAAGPAGRLVGVDRGDVDLVDAQGLLDDLAGEGGEALAGLDGRADDGGDAVVDLDRGRGDLVRALGAEHVDHAERRSRRRGAPRPARPRPRGRPGSSHSSSGVSLGSGGQREVAYGLEQFGDRGRAGHRLAGRAGCRRWPATLRRRSSAGSMPSFGGQLVHLALVRGADLHGALAAHMAGGRVVGADRPALDEGVRDDVRAAGEGDGGGQRLRRRCRRTRPRRAGSAPRP